MKGRLRKLSSIMAALAACDELLCGLKCYTRYTGLPRAGAGPSRDQVGSVRHAHVQGGMEKDSKDTKDTSAAPFSLVDIGANLLDPMFQGIYRDKARHPADFSAVLSRARQAGVTRIMVTAGSLQESREALELCQKSEAAWPSLCCTVGVHPTRCSEFDETGSPEAHLRALVEAAKAAGPFCSAIGECGLDYDRLHFCPRDVQLRYFERQLVELAIPLQKPLFLHCRTSEAASDLAVLLEKYRESLPAQPGVVHSFDGSLEEAEKFISLGFFIGINGCSLKTQENLAVVKSLPEKSILLETDAPWCGIKASHAGYHYVQSTWDEVKKPERWEEGKCVKDRCEPCQMRQVLEVVAGCRGISPDALAKAVLQNTEVFMSSTMT